MRSSLVFILMIFTSQAWSITRTGSCAGAGTSCTLSAVNAGDLKICFAYRSASTTAPSLPAGYLTSTSGSTSNGGTTGSWRIACGQASSSSDTGSGSFTNAGAVACVSYSATSVAQHGTTSCGSGYALGSSASTFDKTSNTVSYNGITTSKTNTTSWVVAFAGASAGVPGVPASLTSQVSGGTGPYIVVADTNGAVNSFTTATASVTSGTWMSVTYEIVAEYVADPVFSPANSVSGGYYTSAQNVTMTSTTSGATICYSTDGSFPSISSPGTCGTGTTYSGAINVSTHKSFVAIGTKAGYNPSNYVTAQYPFYVISSANFNSPAVSGLSTTMDSTDSKLIVVYCTGSTGTTFTISDSAGNTWTSLPNWDSGSSYTARAAWVLNPTTSGTHTFTCNNPSGATYTTIAMGFKNPGFGDMYFDKSCALFSTGTYFALLDKYQHASCSSSLSPTVDNELLIMFAAPAINTVAGMKYFASDGFVTSINHENYGAAFYVQGTKTAVNPNWIKRGPSTTTTHLLAFKPASSWTGRRKRVQVSQ